MLRILRTAQESGALAWRIIAHIRHSPGQLLDLTLQPVLFVVLFVFMFGGAIAGDWSTYLQFVIPGVLVQAVVLSTTATGTGLSLDLTNGIFDRFRSLPISRTAPVLGAILGDSVRYMISGAVVLAFGLAVGFRVHTSALSAVAAYALVVLFGFAICWITAFIGVVARDPRRMQMLSALVMFPLTFGSSVYVSPKTMPGWLAGWVSLNPVSAVANTARSLLLGTPLGASLIHATIAAFLIVAVFAPLTLAAYSRRPC